MYKRGTSRFKREIDVNLKSWGLAKFAQKYDYVKEQTIKNKNLDWY